MASEPYEPVNVQVSEDSAGCCCSSTNKRVLNYPMMDKKKPSWNIVPFNGEFRAEFKATGQGKTFCHRSKPFPNSVKQQMENNTKTSTNDNYQVKIRKSSGFDLDSYFT